MTDSRSILASKLRGASSQLPYLHRALGLVWAAAPRWTLAWAVLLVLQGLLPAATVYLTRALVDGLVTALDGGGWQRVGPSLVVAGLMAGVVLLGELLRSASGYVRTAQSELLQDHISGLIHERSVAVDLAFYELPDFYDHLHRARDQAGYRPAALLESIGSLLQNGLTLAVMGAVLLPFGHWLPVALLLSTLPAFYVVLRYSLRQHRWRLRITADERRTWYYDWLLTAGESAAELRLFGLGDHFRSLYQRLRRRLRDERLQLAQDQGVAELGAGAVALLATGGAMIWMVWRTLNGQATLGDLALFYQVFQQGQRVVRSLWENAAQLYANSLYLGNLFEFLALAPQVVDPPHPIPSPAVPAGAIRFRQVSFRYPGSQRLALQDFDLTIPAGQIVAIVGANGAGKSTLIKLICRLYDPDGGRIEVDGVDLRQLRIEDLRRLITVLVQEPVRYSATVAENIAFGDLAAAPLVDEIVTAARAAGVDETVARLPHGYETLLGKWLAGGTELSVGEWQRVGLSRALLRRAPIILLDEPTSAMDPWAETAWLGRLRRLAAGRTVVIITHRFTTAMRADLIHVMADGRCVESGHHRDLLARGGRYAQIAGTVDERSGAVAGAPGPMRE